MATPTRTNHENRLSSRIPPRRLRFITRSTAKSDKVEQIDGVDHYIISIGVTSDSHPFYTGQKQFVDTEGRIDKFQKRFGAVRRAGKPKLKP